MHRERLSDFVSIKITQTFLERKTSGPWKSGLCNSVHTRVHFTTSHSSPLQSLCVSMTCTQPLRFLWCFWILSGQRILLSGFFRCTHSGVHILTDEQTEQTKQTPTEFVLQPFVSMQPFVFLTAAETSHPWDLNNTRRSKWVKNYYRE